MKTQTTTTNEDENMTNSEIFKRAHAIAKATRAIVGDYRIAFSLALKDIYNTITKKVLTMKAEYIKRTKLNWPALWNDLGMERDSADRWYPGTDTPEWVSDYLTEFRSPSRAHPKSYAQALLTQKFAKLLAEKDPELAVALGVAKEVK